MKKFAMMVLVAASTVGLSASPVLAWYCPKLVEDCHTLVRSTEKRAGVDKGMLAEARKGCEEALRLHKTGKHKQSVVKAGEAISLAGNAVQ